MYRVLSSALAFALIATAASADPDTRSPKDLFGQPRPHGPLVEKAFVGLFTGRTELYFGQPMSVELFAMPATQKGPYVHPRLDHSPNVKLELSDDAGKAVPFVVEHGGGMGSVTGEFLWFRLSPTTPHAIGWHWKPGVYTLTAIVTNPNEPTNPITLPGTLRSNTLKFVVRSANAKKEAADPKREQDGPRGLGWAVDHFWLHVAGLDDESQERIRKRLKSTDEHWALHVAQVAAVTLPQDRKLTPDESAKLRADLGNKSPAVRMLAVRNVPSGASKELAKALMERLTDGYQEYAFGPGDPIPVYPIRTEAGAALVRLGRENLPDLVRFAQDQKNGLHNSECVRLIGKIGHHADAEKWFREMLDGDVDDLHYSVQEAAAAWGKDGAALSRQIVMQPKIRKEIHRDAVTALGASGDLQKDADLLRPLLASANWEMQWASVGALTKLGDKNSLPAFEKIARDSAIDQNARYAAVDAVLRFADAKAADQLLLDLAGRPKDRLRAFALLRAGARKQMAALPTALAALDDSDWYTRVMADYALRGLAGDRLGVGYDPQKPDSKRWHEFWKKK